MKLRRVINAHVLSAALLLAVVVLPVAAEPEAPALLPQGFDYTKAMKKLIAQGKKAGAKEGVVLHIGDSITYANTVKECVARSSLWVATTSEEEFKALDDSFIVHNPTTIIDCWRIIDPAKFEKKVNYVAVGKPG